MSNKTTEEKIDYIYNHIKTERKFVYGRRIFKVLMFILFIGYLYYFYAYGFDKLKTNIIESLKPNITTEGVVEGLKNSSGNIFEKAKELYNNNIESTITKGKINEGGGLDDNSY